MGSFVNPVYAYGMVPGGMNPTGNQLSMGGTRPFSGGSNPLLPTTNPSASSPASTNPYGIVPATSTSSSFPANTGPYSSSPNLFGGGGATGAGGSQQFGGFLSGMSNKDVSRLFGSLKKTYGDGMAHMILDFLKGGAGFNQQAISNLLAAMKPGIERGEEDIMEQFSVMGNRFGSPAAIGLGDFLSRVNLNEGELITQMYEDSLNRFMDVMMGAAGTNAQRIASSPSTLDQILNGLGLGSAGAKGLLDAGVGGGSGTLSSILSGLAAA